MSLLQVGKGYNADSLADACQVSKRTIFRDLDMLRECGVPVLFHDEQKRYFLNGEFFLPPTNFTTEEALALIVLCHELGGSGGVPFYTAARSAASKLESALPGRLREHLLKLTQAVEINLEPRNSSLEENEPTYQQLLRAIAHRQEVRLEYQSLTEWEHISTKLSPYRVLFSRRSWYVVGRSSLHREVRTFNVSRIHSLEVLDTHFTIPPRFSLERYLRNAWHLIPEPGDDYEIVIRFEKLVAQNVAEIVWHRTQRIEHLPDGRIDFHVTVSGLNEISWWILGYGDQATVLQPPALRELLAKRIARMSTLYGE